MALGKNVRKFREAAGLTQTELAELAGMDQQALGALELRDSKSSRFTPDLARALGKSVDELLGTAAGPEKSAAPAPSNYVDGDEVARLIALYVSSTEQGRMQIMDSAEVATKIAVGRRGKAAKD